MNKKSFIVVVLAMSLLLTSQALAHATVKPNSVGIGKFQSFTLGVPSEKPIATVGVRLVLPDNLNYFTPNVKPGWKINIKKGLPPNVNETDINNINNEPKTIEINWTGGNIPAEMRDEFTFSAQVPDQPTTLKWKVYQTYTDGTIVSWDQDPSITKENTSSEESEDNGPYSKTEVIDDLTPTVMPKNSTNLKNVIAVGLSALSLLISLIALKKNK